jgi:hypothetical protein
VGCWLRLGSCLYSLLDQLYSVLLPRLALSFSPLSFDSEYRSGLSYACGVSRVSLRIHTRTCVHGNGLVQGNGPRVGRAREGTEGTSFLCV